MRIIFGFILLCGLGLAGFAAYLVTQQFNQYAADLAEAKRLQVPNIELTEVMVAKNQLQYGQELTTDDVLVLEWPVDAVPEGAFTDIEALFGEGDTEPRVVLRVMETAEAILAVKVSEFGGDIGPRGRLTPGMRAFALRVDVITGVSGFLRPDDKIDIYWTGSDGDTTITKLILENIRLLAVDQSSNQESSRVAAARSVTVEVSPQVVARLTQAQQTGKITLSLRGIEDAALTGTVVVDTTDVTGVIEQVVEQERICTQITRKGVEVITVEVPCTD